MKIRFERLKIRYHPYPCFKKYAKKTLYKLEKPKLKSKKQSYTLPSYRGPLTSKISNRIDVISKEEISGEPINFEVLMHKFIKPSQQFPKPKQQNNANFNSNFVTNFQNLSTTAHENKNADVNREDNKAVVQGNYLQNSKQNVATQQNNTHIKKEESKQEEIKHNIKIKTEESQTDTSHQESAFEFLKNCVKLDLKSAILCMTVGSGKTKIAIDFANYLNVKTAFVTKADVTSHIEREILRWDKTSNHLIDVYDKKKFIIFDIEYSLIIIDECHLLASERKNVLVKFITEKKHPKFILMLSGTPGDADDQIRMLHFFDRSANVDNIFHFDWKPANLPQTEIINLQLNNVQQKAWDEFKNNFNDLKGQHRFPALQKIREKMSRWKMEDVIRLIAQLNPKCNIPILIISQFSAVIRELDYFLPDFYTRRRIDSGTKISDRDRFVQQFQNGNINMLLATTSAIGHGIEISNAKILISFEPSYLKQQQTQSFGRIFRLGSKTHNQKIINLIFLNTMEDRLSSLNFSED